MLLNFNIKNGIQKYIVALRGKIYLGGKYSNFYLIQIQAFSDGLPCPSLVGLPIAKNSKEFEHLFHLFNGELRKLH
jgi:hypothetical protein